MNANVLAGLGVLGHAYTIASVPKVWVVTEPSIFGGPVLAVCGSERAAKRFAYLHRMRRQCERTQERRDFTLRDGRKPYCSRDDYRRILENWDPEPLPKITEFAVRTYP